MSISGWDAFSAACGLSGPLTLGLSSGAQPHQPFRLARPSVVIGRDERALLRLKDPAVSRRHAYLQVLGNRLFVIDLESRAGIALRGTQELSGWLDPGQHLTIGQYRIERIGPSPADSLAGGVPTDDPLVNRLEPGQALLASFNIFLRDSYVARWRMNRQLALVGRSPRWRIHLGDLSVSKAHCSLVATSEGIWVVDLQSREGTRVRGEKVEVARLEDGDAIQIGNYCLRVEYHRPAAASTSPAPGNVPLVLREENPGLLAPLPSRRPKPHRRFPAASSARRDEPLCATA
jgi:pSer/pThr/pTyr-binding forkhead associated (FHA) protein